MKDLLYGVAIVVVIAVFSPSIDSFAQSRIAISSTEEAELTIRLVERSIQQSTEENTYLAVDSLLVIDGRPTTRSEMLTRILNVVTSPAASSSTVNIPVRPGFGPCWDFMISDLRFRESSDSLWVDCKYSFATRQLSSAKGQFSFCKRGKMWMLRRIDGLFNYVESLVSAGTIRKD